MRLLGSAYYNIRFGDIFFHFLIRYGFSIQFACQVLCFIQCPVSHVNNLYIFICKRFCHKSPHLSSTYYHYCFPSSPPNSFSASSTAAEPIDTEPLFIPVSFRVRFPTWIDLLNAVSRTFPTAPAFFAIWNNSFTWPRIWSSPTIIDSRPEVRRKRCLSDSSWSRKSMILEETFMCFANSKSTLLPFGETT